MYALYLSVPAPSGPVPSGAPQVPYLSERLSETPASPTFYSVLYNQEVAVSMSMQGKLSLTFSTVYRILVFLSDKRRQNSNFFNLQLLKAS